MSDTDSDIIHAGGDEALLSVTARELCNQLRANDPQYLLRRSTLRLSDYITYYSNHFEADCIAVFQALKENTSVKHIDFDWLLRRNHTKRSALAVAVYLESSNTLQTLNLGNGCPEGSYKSTRDDLCCLASALS
jgi:hypothetical protein